jgi:hypothetical protein
MSTVIFLGAGATKSCGGPLTSEILPNILGSATGASGPLPVAREHNVIVQEFLESQFNVRAGSRSELYPGLPLLMSLIDTALDRRQSFHPDWDLDRVARLREAIEFGIFDHLEERLENSPTNNHLNLLQRAYPAGAEPMVITTNYDVIMDTAMMWRSESNDEQGRFPDYRCQISSDFYRNEPRRFGVLLKLHGSLSWLYCRTCGRLEIGASEQRKYLKVLARMVGPSLEASFAPDGAPCPTCKTKLRPLLIAPTHLKNYRNAHVAQVWYEAEQLLRRATRVVFVGYSLPEDDVEVVYLLKRSLHHLPGDAITVVEYDGLNPNIALAEHATGRRYRALFGDKVNWRANGLDRWLEQGAPGLA